MTFRRATVVVRRPDNDWENQTPHQHPGGFWFLWECETCGALVEERACVKHTAWHLADRKKEET